eukprot:14209310-Alexandrium_andersonii.AAC.1
MLGPHVPPRTAACESDGGGLQRRSRGVDKNRAEQPAQASRNLQGSKVTRQFRGDLLGYPDQQ